MQPAQLGLVNSTAGLLFIDTALNMHQQALKLHLRPPLIVAKTNSSLFVFLVFSRLTVKNSQTNKQNFVRKNPTDKVDPSLFVESTCKQTQ
jgi:hypothetical protein